MFYATVLIGENTGGHSCIQILPSQVNDSALGTRTEVIQCTGLANGGGCSMIRITDPKMQLVEKFEKETEGKNELGRYMINRVSNTQYLAMVVNSNCQVAKVVSECGCFITSASRVSDGIISWTVVGMDSKSISNFVSRMERSNFPVRRTTSYLPNCVPTLTAKQEESLKLAFKNGYYEVPRKTTIHELCQTAGVSPAAFNITLRAAERKVLSYYLSNNRDSVITKKK
jgi:predicted DNA binding protein